MSMNETKEARQARIRRARLGAWYGFLCAAAFVVVAAFIDIWLNPDLPLEVNGSLAAVRLSACLGLALVGAITCWWQELWHGLLSGALVAAVLALVSALFTSEVSMGVKFLVLVFILLPVAALALPLAWLLRWLAERHARAGSAVRRVLGLAAIALMLGAVAGFFTRTSSSGIEAIRQMNVALQTLSAVSNPLHHVAGLLEHDGMPYTLSAVESQTSTSGFDVQMRYADGYRAQCTVVIYPGQAPHISNCRALPKTAP